MGRVGSGEFWMPGWRQAATFLLIALLGLGAWWSRVALAPSFNPPGLLDEAFDTGVVLYALLALAAGLAAPEGFYLWGVAVVISHPVSALALAAYQQQAQGHEIVRDGAQGWVGFAFVLVMMTFVTAMLITALSAAGAALRLLLQHHLHGRPGTPRDARAR